jgi:endo-1,4-beta-xylanase
MHRLIIILLLLVVSSFTLQDAPICTEARLYEKAKFPIGVAINTDKLKSEENYWKTAMAQFNSFTPEKVMKPQYIHPKREVYNFWEVDHLSEFCKENKIRLHGHTLIWHKSLPPWMENFKGNRDEWDAMMKEHIQTIVAHCKNFVKSWDVVNEAFNDDGTLRKNIWLKNIGEDYIEKAFRYAAEADSGAILFYNDYSLEHNGQKLGAVLSYISKMRAKKIKVDGIGLQMHVSLERPTISDINGAAQNIQHEGLLVHYSELDVSLRPDHSIFTSKKKLLELQYKRMKEIVQGYMKLNPHNRFGITLWGVSDNDSWLSEDSFRARPLLFNRRYKIKPAYCGFIEGLGN